ncbi:MAG TPA: hypothetical protein VFT36_00395 [Methylomirabilota bacterium]|nr:hypothetical protein [Methylomirabilota bacterium]
MDMVAGERSCECEGCGGEKSLHGLTRTISLAHQVAVCAAGHASEEALHGGPLPVKATGSSHDLRTSLGVMEGWPEEVVAPLREAFARPEVAAALDAMTDAAMAAREKPLFPAAEILYLHQGAFAPVKAAADSLAKWEEASRKTEVWRRAFLLTHSGRDAVEVALLNALADFIRTTAASVERASKAVDLTPAPAKTEPQPPAPPSYEDVRRAALRFMQAKGKPALAEKLKAFGAAKAPDLKPEQYAAFVEALK